MPKRAQVLTALQVSRLTTPGLHFVGEVPGLALQVTDSGARSWILRYAVGTKRRDMGLGGYPGVTLAGAREAARRMRELLREGVDPIEATRAKRSALVAEAARAMTFDQCARAYIDAHSAGWRSPKHATQWSATLNTYASPVIGRMLVRDIALPHIMRILEPIWREKTETASRVRGRVESVLDWATVRGYRSGDNPARWRGHLDQLLPARSKVAKVKNFAALPYGEIGDFMERLRKAEGMGARALELAILCASRSGEVRGATWGEIDLDAAVWTIPGDRMKAGREHRVPLSPAAVALLRSLPGHKQAKAEDIVFPSTKGTTLSDATLGAVLKRMGLSVTAHGFRSAFRDWAAETTGYPAEVVEMALAHAVANKVEAAYRRGDLFEKRRRLMAEWATYCGKPSPKAGTVQPLRGAA